MRRPTTDRLHLPLRRTDQIPDGGEQVVEIEWLANEALGAETCRISLGPLQEVWTRGEDDDRNPVGCCIDREALQQVPTRLLADD